MPRKLLPLSAFFLACLCGFIASRASAGERVVYAFKGGTDGSNPVGGLIEVGGKFYGMTADGGASGFGTIFSLTPDGTKTTLYSFKGGSDGETPTGGLEYVGDKFYGDTTNGGNGAGPNCNASCGTVFSVTRAGIETVLAAFSGTGSSPQFPNGSGLVSIGDTLYGVSTAGGSLNVGSVFSVTTGGTLNVLYSFGKKYPQDGLVPYATLTKMNGVLYGNTSGSAGVNSGVIYSVTPKGKETVLHIISRPKVQGYHPISRLAYLGNTLYGTNSEGGQYNGGTFFLCRPTGKLRKLYAFGAPGDGINPLSLTRVNRTFYGAANGGGSSGKGMLFAITEAGVETQLYSFSGTQDATAPNSRLLNVNGTFYGTSTSGGGSTQCSGGCGTVFSYAP